MIGIALGIATPILLLASIIMIIRLRDRRDVLTHSRLNEVMQLSSEHMDVVNSKNREIEDLIEKNIELQSRLDTEISDNKADIVRRTRAFKGMANRHASEFFEELDKLFSNG